MAETTPDLSTTAAAERAAAFDLAPSVLVELKNALPGVASDAVEAIIDEVPSYASARAYLVGNIESAVQVALGSFLDIAARSADPSTPLRPATEASYALGRGEARSGRSMDALLSAYRIGARVSWRELSEVAVEAGMSAPALAQFAELVFAYIDELSAASVVGHADELATVERIHERELERLALDLCRGASDETVADRADRARWELPQTVTTLLVTGRDLHGVRSLVDPSSLVLTEDLPGVEAGVDLMAVIVPGLRARERTRLLRRLGGLDVVVGPTRPLATASSSYARALKGHAARAAAAAAGGGARGRRGRSGPTAYDTDAHLAEIVLDADPEAREDLRRQALAPLADLTPATQQRLAETLRLWILHRGRREAVAEALFVHPQTVRYRVGQLRELFGDDLDDPRRVADLVIALGVPPAA
jgi:sugar diacid utilization regulator